MSRISLRPPLAASCSCLPGEQRMCVHQSEKDCAKVAGDWPEVSCAMAAKLDRSSVVARPSNGSGILLRLCTFSLLLRCNKP